MLQMREYDNIITQTHSHGKYDNGKGGYLKFYDDDKMSYKYIKYPNRNYPVEHMQPHLLQKRVTQRTNYILDTLRQEIPSEHFCAPRL